MPLAEGKQAREISPGADPIRYNHEFGFAFLRLAEWLRPPEPRHSNQPSVSFSHMPRIVKSAIKRKTWLLLAHARLYIIRRPALRRIISAAFAHYPQLEKSLKQRAMATLSAQSDQAHGAYELAHPTARAQRVYADLKLAMEQRMKGST